MCKYSLNGYEGYLPQEKGKSPAIFPTVALTVEFGGFILGKKGSDGERESSEPGDSKKQMGLSQSGAGGHPSRFLIQGWNAGYSTDASRSVTFLGVTGFKE